MRMNETMKVERCREIVVETNRAKVELSLHLAQCQALAQGQLL
jgi:hypothetical protein